MKPKYQIIAAALAVCFISSVQLTAASLSAPAPEFRSSEQLRQEIAHHNDPRIQIRSNVRLMEDSGVFYTGKIVEADSGNYLFMFRNYAPELSRWTTCDPSGFPNGVNNYCFGGSPTYGLDADGLVFSPITISSDDTSGTGYTSFASLTFTGTPAFSTSAVGNCYTASASFQYSFMSHSFLHLPPSSGVLTSGGQSGLLSSTFRNTTSTHENWHGVIHANALQATYGALETWAAAYTSNKFDSAAGATAAATSDIANALAAATTSYTNFYSSLGAGAHGGINTYAFVNSSSLWESHNPNWGGTISSNASNITMNFQRTPGSGSCE